MGCHLCRRFCVGFIRGQREVAGVTTFLDRDNPYPAFVVILSRFASAIVRSRLYTRRKNVGHRVCRPSHRPHWSKPQGANRKRQLAPLVAQAKGSLEAGIGARPQAQGPGTMPLTRIAQQVREWPASFPYRTPRILSSILSLSFDIGV